MTLSPVTCVLSLALVSLPFCKRGAVMFACCRRVFTRIKWNGAFRSFSMGLATRKYTRRVSYYYCCYYHDRPPHLDGLLHCSLWEAQVLKSEWNKSLFPCVTQAVI